MGWKRDTFPSYRLSQQSVEDFLTNLFGYWDFQIKHENDHWKFVVPRRLTLDERDILEDSRDYEPEIQNFHVPKNEPEIQDDPEIQNFIQWFNESRVPGLVDPASDEAVYFLPEKKLLAYLKDQGLDRLKRLLRAIFPHDEDLPNLPNEIADRYCKIFCILLLIGRARSIRLFVQHESLRDDLLPFSAKNPPPNFPTSTEDRNFLELFCERQWSLCAPKLDYKIDREWATERVIPITKKEKVDVDVDGSAAKIYKVEVHPEYNELQSSGLYTTRVRGDPPANIFALKVYREKDAQHYKAEYSAFHKLNKAKSIIGFYGSWRQGNRYNILLEYANSGTLEDYLRTTNPPINGEDIIDFWEGHLQLLEGLFKIHYIDSADDLRPPLQGFHQDVKPANILVTNSFTGEGSPYRYNFKIADLGISHFKTQLSPNEDVYDQDSQGTLTYGAPECHRPDNLTKQTQLLVKSNVDIWSMGAIFSEVAVWLVFNYRSLQDYRIARREATKGTPAAEVGDCFHDGEKVLPVVHQWHDNIKDNVRDSDYITERVLEMVGDMMLPANIRPNSRYFHQRSQGILKDARRIYSEKVNLKTIDFDLQSLVSMNTSFHDSGYGSTAPASSNNILEPATEQVLLTLISDDVFREMLVEAAHRAPRQIIVRNVNRLLEYYQKDLRQEMLDTELSNPQQIDVVTLIGRYTKWFAQRLYDLVESGAGNSDSDQPPKLPLNPAENANKRMILERYLTDRGAATIETTLDTKEEAVENLSGSSEGSLPANDESSFPNLENLQRFMLQGKAFLNMKASFEKFLNRKMTRQQTEQELTIMASSEVQKIGNYMELTNRDIEEESSSKNADGNSNPSTSYTIEDDLVLTEESQEKSLKSTTKKYNKIAPSNTAGDQSEPDQKAAEANRDDTTAETVDNEVFDKREAIYLRSNYSLYRIGSIALRNVQNYFRRILFPRLQEGFQRIEWNCGCGHLLYADFKNQSPDDLRRMASILQCASNPTIPSPQTSQMQNTASTSGQTVGKSPTPITPQGGSATSASDPSPTTLSTVPPQISCPTIDSSFLELCVNTGEYHKSLGEIDLKHVKSDGDFFQAIRTEYSNIRGIRQKFRILKPAKVSYVRFSVDHRYHVGIMQTPKAFPPKDEVDSGHWIYEPCPRDEDLPIAENVFLHYMNCNERPDNIIWLKRMPRKLKTKITDDKPAPVAFGWGVHIDEGPNYYIIAWGNVIALVISGIVAIIWSIYKGDFQGAFGFASWLVMVVNTFMVAFIYRYKQI